jgi:hypothetical protein
VECSFNDGKLTCMYSVQPDETCKKCHFLNDSICADSTLVDLRELYLDLASESIYTNTDYC